MANDPITPRRARYLQIADAIRRQIEDGHYRPGDRLPTEVDLARQHGVSRITSAAALTTLARAGLVERAPRRGTVVRRISSGDGVGARPLLAFIHTRIDIGFSLAGLHSFERAARGAGFDLLIRFTGASRAEEEQAIRDALRAGATGIALVPQDGETYNAEILRLVLDGFPVVLLDRFLRGVPCAAVGSDNQEGARALVGALIAAGHRTVCALAFQTAGTSTIEERLAGYTQALTGAGVAIDHSLIYAEGGFLELDDHWQIPAPLVERLADFLRHRADVTAIFATNAQLALLAMQAIARVGLRVPEDLSLVSVDTFEVIPLGPPLLTCALQRGTEIGAAAVDLLEEGLAGSPPRRVLLPMEIRTGRSIAPPAGRDQARADSPVRRPSASTT